MRIFISWSGEQSEAVAEEFQQFVRIVVAGTDPWVSAGGIEKGTRWSTELAKSLDEARAGIICLTADNLTHPWILFEAGALSRKPSDKVWTLLLNIGKEEVAPPLGMFQHTVATDDGEVWEMVQSINNSIEPRRKEADLRKIFDAMWPTSKARIIEIQAMPRQVAARKRDPNEMIAEVLEVVRGLTRDVGSDRWKVEKTVKMLKHVYMATVGAKPPTLAQLALMDEKDDPLEGLFQINTDLPPGSQWRNAILDVAFREHLLGRRSDALRKAGTSQPMGTPEALLDLLKRAKGEKQAPEGGDEKDATPKDDPVKDEPQKANDDPPKDN